MTVGRRRVIPFHNHGPTVRVGDGDPPLGVVLAGRHLPGDIGDDRPEPGDLGRVGVEPGQGGEIDVEVDHPAPPLGGAVHVEAVQEDVGPQLVDAAGIAGPLGGVSLGVERPHARHRPLGGEVASHQVSGPIGVREAHDSPFLDRRLVPPRGLLGLHGEGEPTNPGSQLTGGEVLCLLQHSVGHTAGLCFLKVTGPLTDHPGPGQIDPALAQRLPHLGEPFNKIESEAEMHVGRSPGETQRRSDLLGGELVDGFDPLRRHRIRGAVSHLGHGGVELGLVVGDLTGNAPATA